MRLSLALCLRNSEAHAVQTVRDGFELARALAPESHEILALDEGSHDNTLAVLSLLHEQIPTLRTLQDLDPGRAIMRAARVARGEYWFLTDGPFDPALGRWALEQAFSGQAAAIVRGELLVVERGLGQAALGWLRGGLAAAQHEVRRALNARGEQPAFTPGTRRGLSSRASLFVRRRLGRVGLGRFDRRRD